MIERGGIYWVDLGDPRGHQPGKRRPVLVVQSNDYNRSRLGTVVAAVITSNTTLAALPGNVFLPASVTGLPKDSVVNVTAVITLDRDDVGDLVTTVPTYLSNEVDQGLRRILAL